MKLHILASAFLATAGLLLAQQPPDSGTPKGELKAPSSAEAARLELEQAAKELQRIYDATQATVDEIQRSLEAVWAEYGGRSKLASLPPQRLLQARTRLTEVGGRIDQVATQLLGSRATVRTAIVHLYTQNRAAIGVHEMQVVDLNQKIGSIQADSLLTDQEREELVGQYVALRDAVERRIERVRGAIGSLEELDHSIDHSFALLQYSQDLARTCVITLQGGPTAPEQLERLEALVRQIADHSLRLAEDTLAVSGELTKETMNIQ